MNTTLKIGLACAFGGFVGTLTALSVNGYFWWIGMLVGGLTGYLSYEFRMVIHAIPLAWQVARKSYPDKTWWGMYFAVLIRTAVLVFMWGSIIFGVISFVILLLNERLTFVKYCFFGLAFVSIVTSIGDTRGQFTGPDYVSRRDILISILEYNPITVFLIVLFHLLIGLWWVVKHFPAGIRIAIRIAISSFPILLRFLSHLFKLIHSEERLLCLCDAAIGTGIGYFLGHPLWGTVIGGVVGVLNYEIISVRVLKLLPKRIA